MAVLAFAVHIVVNVLGGYGYFRDELYYIACSKHLAAGYVDQPPLSIIVLAGTELVFGNSIFAIRLVPAILSGVSAALVGLLARRMGGGRAAVVLASLAFIAAPQILGFHTYYSMNSLDIMFWLLAVHALLDAAERGTLRNWVLLGLVLGLGLLNKTSVLWLGAGVGAAILLSGQLRRQLATPGPYAAAVLALVLFSPFVIWNALHGWPHIEFMRNATAGKYSSLTRARFLADQFLAMNPLTYLISLPGLVWCLAHRDGRRWRPIGIVFLTVFAVLLINPHTKSEYMAAAYPMLFAAGGVAVELMRPRWRAVAVPVLSVLIVASGATLAPLAMPVLPVDTYVRYARALGMAPSTPENLELSDLPQFFADMQGWEELARDVSKAYLTIPEPERGTTIALVSNYGEAGASSCSRAAMRCHVSSVPTTRTGSGASGRPPSRRSSASAETARATSKTTAVFPWPGSTCALTACLTRTTSTSSSRATGGSPSRAARGRSTSISSERRANHETFLETFHA
jgi:hypothetical protein